MLKQRIITAIILALLALSAIFSLPAFYFAIAMGVVVLLAAREWARIVSSEGRIRVLSFASFAFLLGLSAYFIPLDKVHASPIFNFIILAAVLWWFVGLVLMRGYPESAKAWKDNTSFKLVAGVTTLLPFYWAVIYLRAMDPSDITQGGRWLLYVLALVWAADSGAYFVGKRFGKHPLAAKVSPKKTIEGLLGGLATSALVSLIAIVGFALYSGSLFGFLAASACAVVFSVLGDLVESMFKRQAGIKDSGRLLPGHGGLLDRIDSLCAAVPVFVACHLLWM